MTRRALPSLLDTQRMHSIPYYSGTTPKSTVRAKVWQTKNEAPCIPIGNSSTFVPLARLLRRYDARRRPKSFQEASWTLLESFRENSKIRAFSNFRCHTKNLSILRKFAQRIESHQRHHESIAFCFRKGRKLLRIKTNTQIRSYDRFSDPTARKNRSQVEPNFLCARVLLYEQKGSTSHFRCRCITLELRKAVRVIWWDLVRAVYRQPLFTARDDS